MLTAADSRQVSLIGLLDLSAAFDCVDHDLLLQRLQLSFRPTGVVLQWIKSFLNLTQQIAYRGQLSATLPLLFGVPQSSVRAFAVRFVHCRTLPHSRKTQHAVASMC